MNEPDVRQLNSEERAAPASVSDSDAQLIQDLNDGSPEAIAEVRRWIRGAAAAYRGSLSEHLEDLEQEVVIAILQALGENRFQGASSLQTYVRRAMTYRCINRLRDLRRRELVPLEDLEVASESPDGHQRAESRQRVRLALTVQAEMAAQCRQLWRLLEEGIGYREMSQRLGVRPGTLRVRLLRCRRAAIERWRQLTGSNP